MSIKHRESFLNHIAKQLKRDRIKQVKQPVWTKEPQKKVYKHLSIEDLIHLLERQCQTIHTTFRRTVKEQLPQVMQNIFQEVQAKSIILPRDERTRRLGLEQFFAAEKNNYTIKTWENFTKEEAIEFAEQADIGLAYSDITLAESGTVTLLHNESHGRTLTLLPRVFVAVIERKTIVPRMTEAMSLIRQRRPKNGKLPSCISFISGPSNSADIELNLIVGVHGPIQAYYIVIDD